MILSSNVEELIAGAVKFVSLRWNSFRTSISASCRVFKLIITLSYYWLKSNSRAWATANRSPITGPEEPREFQEVKVPRFHEHGTG